ncbi:ribonuclease Z [Paenibacillus sp. GCM10012307]|uniref:Ribonuclease Z n=1 Tax=Paenibacillus roseus TaxID=2798579 RepID=A0A934J543_9BACL|nr:ribonuclease Z [Paenibacillus roseus]MBJ6360590.1 ribonuclease Z [Paenibacillus roseus]
MELCFLGTGAGRPAKNRNVTSIILQFAQSPHGLWLFDCGEGSQHQLMHTPYKINRISHIFITHLHGDHIFGLPGLLSSRAFQGGTQPVVLFGPKGLKQWLDTTLSISQTHLGHELEIREIEEGVIFEDERYRVEARILEHRIACFGYRVVEKAQPGRLKVELLKEMGLTAGPLYGRLKRGEDVVIGDGAVIYAKYVTEPPVPGRIITILGDTKPCAGAVELARNADLVVHEATFEAALKEKAKEFGHSTTKHAALTAKEAGAKQLFLTHFSSRYNDEDTEKLVEEAREIFPNTEAARDLHAVKIKAVKTQI